MKYEKETETVIKICGVTSARDALLARESGADLVGVLVEVAVSPRSVALEEARGIARAAGRAVALTYDASASLNRAVAEQMELEAVQLCGTESPQAAGELADEIEWPVWKSLHLETGPDGGQTAEGILESIEEYTTAGVRAIVLDTATGGPVPMRGGTGKVHDWRLAGRVVAGSRLPVFLAGGLDPGNVARAIREVSPAGVDVSSGVEACPGVKDPARLAAFISAVRAPERSPAG